MIGFGRYRVDWWVVAVIVGGAVVLAAVPGGVRLSRGTAMLAGMAADWERDRAAIAAVLREDLESVRARVYASGGAAAAGADLLQALGQDVFQLGYRAALQQHVPVGARRLGLLLLRLVAVDEARDAAVELALPGGGYLGVDGERHLEPVALGAQVLAGLTRSQLGVAVGLVADGSEAAPAQHALAHGRLSLRVVVQGQTV
ncbi:hypothetical protein GCM10009558_098760 [Virgisporangium aurantiacum]